MRGTPPGHPGAGGSLCSAEEDESPRRRGVSPVPRSPPRWCGIGAALSGCAVRGSPAPSPRKRGFAARCRSPPSRVGWTPRTWKNQPGGRRFTSEASAVGPWAVALSVAVALRPRRWPSRREQVAMTRGRAVARAARFAPQSHSRAPVSHSLPSQ